MTPQYVRELLGWPQDVPDALLQRHLDLAERELLAKLSSAPDPNTQDWWDAVALWAAASALPALHTFALQGAAKVARLESSVEWRFLAPDEWRALQEEYRRRAMEALSRLSSSEDEPLMLAL